MPYPKIKIAHFLSSRLETLAGGDLVILNLLKYLDRERFEPWIACFDEGRNPGLPMIIKIAQERSINTHIVNVRGRFDISAVSKLKQFLENEGVHILHCHGYKADVIASLISKSNRPKTVTTLHGWWIGSSPKLKFYDWLDLRAIKNFNKIITVAEHIKTELLKKGFSTDKVICIPNGVDIEKMRLADGSKIRKELGISDGSTIVGIAGRLNKEKGHKYLLRAVANIPDITLLVVGTGILEKDLINLSEKLNIKERVIFTGFKSEASEYIAAMDIFVLPSLSEGLPLALLEAMAAGKPVIASNVGGIPTVIEHGKTGILVESRNVGEMEKAISDLINDKDFSNTIANNGRKFVENNFSLVATTKRYKELYLKLLNEG